MARMFIALSAETREVRLAAAGYRKVINGLLPGVGFRPEPSLHITLRFLGEVGPDTVVELREQLRDIAINHKGMRLTLEGLGMFDGSSAVFAGVSGASVCCAAALADLQQDVEAAARALGFPDADYPFNPHITLGRVAGSTEDLGALRAALPGLAAESVGFEAAEVALYESVRTEHGPTYLANGIFSLWRTYAEGE